MTSIGGSNRRVATADISAAPPISAQASPPARYQTQSKHLAFGLADQAASPATTLLAAAVNGQCWTIGPPASPRQDAAGYPHPISV